MTMYRDPLAGLRSQIATKRGILASREEALTDLLRAMLPAALLDSLARLRPKVDAEPESLAALTDIDAALDTLLAAHEQAAALVPKLRECPDEVPDPPRSQIRPPWVIEEEEQLNFRALFTQRLAEVEPEAYVVRWDDHTYLSRFSLTNAPLVVAARYEVTAGMPDYARCFARTSVPETVPRIDVHAEGLIHALGRVLHLVHDASTGDAFFDHAFVLDAPPGTVALLDPHVRAALLGLSARHPRLLVSHGIAELTWRSDSAPQHIIPDDVLAVLLGIRAAIERA